MNMILVVAIVFGLLTTASVMRLFLYFPSVPVWPVWAVWAVWAFWGSWVVVALVIALAYFPLKAAG